MAAQLRLKLDRKPPFLREDFIASEASVEALRLLDAWPAWPGGALALVGPPGSGKTHLATAWAVAADAHVLSDEAHRTRDVSALEGRPVLLEAGDREGLDELLFHLINMAARPGGGLLVTTRRTPAAWPARLPDLRSRLNALPCAILGEPDDPLLEALLQKFFRERNIRPADDLLPYLARRIERSAPAAQAVVARLDDTAAQEQRSVSKALARRILELEPGQAEQNE